MNYLHNVSINCESGPALRHFRETQRESGLIEVTEIARTHVHGKQRKDTTSVVMPSRYLIDMMPTPVDTLDILAKSVIADDLNSFVRTGIEAWERLVTGIGAVGGRATMVEAECRKAATEPRDDGLVLIEEVNPRDMEFTGFYGTPDELEKLRELENSLNAANASIIDVGRNSPYL